MGVSWELRALPVGLHIFRDFWIFQKSSKFSLTTQNIVVTFEMLLIFSGGEKKRWRWAN
jgi:hypothetical protein